jgi:hypothetical protein
MLLHITLTGNKTMRSKDNIKMEKVVEKYNRLKWLWKEVRDFHSCGKEPLRFRVSKSEYDTELGI